MFVEASGGGSVKKVLEPKITTRDEGLVVILGSKTERSLGGRKSFNNSIVISLRTKLGWELNRASKGPWCQSVRRVNNERNASAQGNRPNNEPTRQHFCNEPAHTNNYTPEDIVVLITTEESIDSTAQLYCLKAQKNKIKMEDKKDKKKPKNIVIPPKKPKLSKAERRALQESQRAAKGVKAGGSGDSKDKNNQHGGGDGGGGGGGGGAKDVKKDVVAAQEGEEKRSDKADTHPFFSHLPPFKGKISKRVWGSVLNV